MTATDFPALITLLAEGGSNSSSSEASRQPSMARRCVSLRRLIAMKRAAGRPKDLNVIAELEALLEERERDD